MTATTLKRKLVTRRATVWAVLAALAVGLAAAAGLSPGTGEASSHREAPYISTDPEADATDVYAFRNPDEPGTISLIAAYNPLEEPAGGPNFQKFGNDVRYWINIDNDGDAKPDVRYLWDFRSSLRTRDVPLYNTGQVTSLTDPDLNFRQVYDLTRFKDGNRRLIVDNGRVAPPNIGPRSTPNYEANLGSAAVTNGGLDHVAFAGPRDDPFFVDLGSIFDLAGLRPLNEAHALPMDNEPGLDGLSGYNVHAMALKVPISRLTEDSKGPAQTDQPVLGVWATAQRQSMRIFDQGRFRSEGPWKQVSRLGMPLVNEVVIPLGAKDKWNASRPQGDVSNFGAYVTDPVIAQLIPVLYAPSGIEVPPAPRNDLVAAFVTGIPGINKPEGGKPGEMIRLNVSTTPTPFMSQDRLGALAGDGDGFPNGRRLIDDVTDIELRVLAGVLNEDSDFHGSPNNLLTDGVDANDVPFMSAWPYLAPPHGGYSHDHTHQVAP
jgi:hypothetical protein